MDHGFGFLAPNYLYGQVFRPIVAVFEKWQFSPREVDFPIFRSKYQKTDAGFGFLAPNYLYGQVFSPIGRFLKNGNFRRGRSFKSLRLSGFSPKLTKTSPIYSRLVTPPNVHFFCLYFAILFAGWQFYAKK